MPYIKLSTSVRVSAPAAQEIKADFGKAIECFPGKTERWLMVEIAPDRQIWFGGDNAAPAAMVDVALLGAVSAAASERMTAEICRILQARLGIAPERVYVKYGGYENWGWNGANFLRAKNQNAQPFP